ncbi:hypothetical protein JCM11491_003617 [Sporobolomyces phaffii]
MPQTPEEQHILARIHVLERDFLSAISNSSSLDEFNTSAQSILHSVAQAIEGGGLQVVTLRQIERVVSMIRVMTQSLGGLKEECFRIEQDFTSRAKDIIQADVAATSGPTVGQAGEVDPFLPLKLWFLDHFTNPYPDSAQKAYFHSRYPTQSRQQLDTWFTNIRRRSGWQEFKRRYTDGTLHDFNRLVAETEREDRSFVVEEARVKIEQIKQYLREGTREKVRDEIQEIVEKGAPSTRTVRQIAPKTRRGGARIANPRKLPSSTPAPPPDALSAFDFRHFDSLVPTTDPSLLELPLPCPNLNNKPSRRAPKSSLASRGPRPTFFESSLVASPSTLTPGQLSPEPRFPSTFSSPTTSIRSCSNSSSSSLDSVLSYDSTSSFASNSPSSPPATSSLIAFQAPSIPLQPPAAPLLSARCTQPASPPRPAPIDNPYFFTLNNTPLLPLPVEPDPVVATSSLAGFAKNGDLLV